MNRCGFFKSDALPVYGASRSPPRDRPHQVERVEKEMEQQRQHKPEPELDLNQNQNWIRPDPDLAPEPDPEPEIFIVLFQTHFPSR